NLSFDVVLEPVSVDDQMLPLEEALTILAYPNPAEDHVTLQFNRATNEVAEITIVDLSGNVISSEMRMLSYKNQQLDLQNMRSGMYLILLRSGNQIHTTIILLK